MQIRITSPDPLLDTESFNATADEFTLDNDKKTLTIHRREASKSYSTQFLSVKVHQILDEAVVLSAITWPPSGAGNVPIPCFIRITFA